MQNIMNKILITTTIPLVFIALSGVANAIECKISQITVLSDDCRDRDKGTKPRTSCTATITAPHNYFILQHEVSSSTAGSTHEKPAIYNSTAYNHTAIKNNQFLSKIVLQSSSVTASCSRSRSYRRRKTCYAIAKITSKAYPHNCLKEVLQDIFNY